MNNTIELIIPAYNEEFRIRKTLLDYMEHGDERLRVVVVLNGCTDRTFDVVESVRTQFPERLRVLNVKEPIGKGAAIVQGWQTASAPVVGFVDADGATSAEEFQKLIVQLDQCADADGVIASRFMPGAIVVDRQSPLRTVMSKAFILLVRSLFRLPYRDTQCGAKLFRLSTLQPLLPSFRRSDMVFDVELLWRLRQRGATVLEIPTFWVDQPGSAALGSAGKFLSQAVRMLISLLRLRF